MVIPTSSNKVFAISIHQTQRFYYVCLVFIDPPREFMALFSSPTCLSGGSVCLSQVLQLNLILSVVDGELGDERNLLQCLILVQPQSVFRRHGQKTLTMQFHLSAETIDFLCKFN